MLLGYEYRGYTGVRWGYRIIQGLSRIFQELHWDYMRIYGGYTAGIRVDPDPAEPLHFTKMVDISPTGWISWVQVVFRA